MIQSRSRPPIFPFLPPRVYTRSVHFCSGARSVGRAAGLRLRRAARLGGRKGQGRSRGWPAPTASPAAPVALGAPGAAAASRPALRPGRCGGGADLGLPRRPAHGRGNRLDPREPRRGLGGERLPRDVKGNSHSER